LLVNNTPVEQYDVRGIQVWVKREDLCAPFPGPSFSKIRGVAAHIANRPEQVIGVLDTYHSKAGHAVAYVCAKLGKHCVDFWPAYKREVQPDGSVALREAQRNALNLGAHLEQLQAGRSAILYHTAKKRLRAEWPNSYLMPNALKLPESVTENAAEVVRSAATIPASGTLICSVSSGTVAAGVIQGLHLLGRLQDYQVVLHLGYSRSRAAVQEYVERTAGVELRNNLTVVDEGYAYADEAGPLDEACPFPCNRHYDLKAWRWLRTREPGWVADHSPILFWNIGY